MSTSKQAGQASERVREAYRRMVTSFQTRLSPETFSDLADLEIPDAYLADPNTGLVYSRYIKDDALPFGVSVPQWFLLTEIRFVSSTLAMELYGRSFMRRL